MATDPRKRQRKLERRHSKRKEKKHLIAREKNQTLGDRLAVAARSPILHCLISEGLEEQGLGQVMLSRQLPDGSVALANFLIDRYCLGVKNAFGRIVGRYTYETDYLQDIKMKIGARPATPPTARKLIEDAVDYARSLGFPPHPDFETAKRLLGDIDSSQSNETFEFGHNGKPLFLNGPNDSPARCKRIIATLANNLGSDGFHFMIGGPAGKSSLPEGADFDDHELEHYPGMGGVLDFDDGEDDEDDDEENSRN